MKIRRYDVICLSLTCLALIVGAANKLRLGAPPDAKPFLTSVRDSASRVIGDVPGMIVKQGVLPRQAFELLRPNVLEARTYTNLADGATFSVLLVHCSNINDMEAHYPPACYPGSGLKVTATDPMPLNLHTRLLEGVEYELTPSRIDERTPIRIWNCMFLPGGSSTYLPDVLRQRGRTGNLRYYGSGQIQVLVPASLSEAQRVSIYNQALAIYEPVLLQMLSNPTGTPPNAKRDDPHE